MRVPPIHVHLDVLLLFGSIAAAYLLACRRHDARTGDRTTRRRRTLFLSGIGVLAVGASWPIHDLAERYLYSVHMTQHLLFGLVAPPLLIAGAPVWMVRRFLGPRPVARAFRLLTRPLPALALFNGALLFTHWPEVVDASVRTEWVHFGLHVLLVGTAVLMWWPVMSRLPEMPPLSAPGQMLYLFLQSLAPTIPASFLTFGDHLLYPVYGTFPRIWGMSALTDQLVAGLIMKLIGGAILWAFIATIFFRWFERERREEGWDASRFAGVEREIRAGMSR